MLARLFAVHRNHIVAEWARKAAASGGRDAVPDPAGGNDPPRTPPTGGWGSDDPVRQLVGNAAETLYNVVSGQTVAEEGSVADAAAALAAWLAVQDETPEQAIGRIYLLKPLLRIHIAPEAVAAGLLGPYLDAESRLDTLVLLVFSAYVRSRERLHNARLAAAQRSVCSLQRWAAQHGLPEGAV